MLQIIRIRLNRGSRLNEEGFHDEAVAELDLAIGLADLGGYGSFKAIALCNRGEARGALGRFDEAFDDVQTSKATFQRLGSLLVSYPLGQAGHLHAGAGQTALAHAAYIEAIDVARRSGDLQGLVPALAGLARLTAADDPAEARRLADEAVASGAGLAECDALLARATVAIVGGELTDARATLDRAAAIARDRRDRAALARATELRASTSTGTDGSRAALHDAFALWEDLQSPLGQGRVLPRARPPRWSRRGPRRSPAPNGCCARSAPAAWRPRRHAGVGRAAGAPVGRPVPRRVRRAARRRRACRSASGSRARRATSSRSSSPGVAGRCTARRCSTCCGPTRTPARPRAACRSP